MQGKPKDMRDVTIFDVLPGAIERSEKAGQQQVVHSDRIPIDMGKVTRAQLEAIGFVFNEDADDLFVNCRLPPGWTKRPTDHSMWSKIVDDKGRERASVFYKAAFYDRSAHMSLTRRFGINLFLDGSDTAHYRAAVTDCGVPVWEAGERLRNDYPASDELEKKCVEWLAENRPDYRDEFAYWNEP